MVDIEQGLSDNSDRKEKLVHAAFKKFMKETKSYAYCPSPDCEIIFRIAEPDEKSKDALLFYCTGCKKNLCRRCKVVYHVGYSCEDFQYINGDEDNSLKVSYLIISFET